MARRLGVLLATKGRLEALEINLSANSLSCPPDTIPAMKNHLSLYAWLFSAAFLLAVNLFYYPKWKIPGAEAAISWDVSGYYFYLPAIFIYKDLKKVGFREEIHRKYQPAGSPYQAFQHEDGNYVMKYSAGMAVQYLPFFLTAHALARLLGYPADGFSRPYQVAISVGSVLIAILGLWFMRKVLLRYFKDGAAAATLLILVLATNYLDYTAINGPMTHNYLFTLYALLIWLTIKFYEHPAYSKALGIGLILGLAALTRPTEIISALIPILWGVGSVAQARERMAFFVRHWPKLALAAAATIAVGSIQLIYWKYVSGDWIVYSYQEQGFSWLKPHIRNGLFSYRAGWLIYTPVMGFALLGFITLARQYRQLFPATFLFTLLFIYIAFAWDIWWYGGSLGQRSMVQAYAVLALPLASFITWAGRRAWTAYSFAALCLFFAYANLWWTHQAHLGGLFASEQMNRPYFQRIFLRNHVPDEVQKLLDTDELFEGERKNVKLLKEENFESDTATFYCSLPPIEGGHSICLDAERQYSPPVEVSLSPADGEWVRAEAAFRCEYKEWNIWQMTQFIVRFVNGEQVVKERSIRVYRFLDSGETKRLYIDSEFPEAPFDKVVVFCWNANGSKPIVVDEVRVEVFED